MTGIQDLPGIRRALYRRAERRRIKGLRALYGQFAGPGDTVFDVGAHHGFRTDAFRALGARVIAVEPQSSALEALHRRFDADPDVVIVAKAAGAGEGFAELNVATRASTISSIGVPEWHRKRFPDEEWDGVERVQVTTLDALISEYGIPAFAKVDVEGYELEVFRGLSTALPALSFEWTPQGIDQVDLCTQRLEELGIASFTHSLGESHRLEEGWVSGDEIRSILRNWGRPDAWGDVYACRDPQQLRMPGDSP